MFGFALNTGVGSLLAFCVTVFGALLLSRFSVPLKLMAEPGEHRLHTHPTPVVGGLAMFMGLLVGLTASGHADTLLLLPLFVLCLVGALDDRYALPSWSRFLAQGFAVWIMIELTGVKLESLGNLSPGHEWRLDAWAVPVTVFAAIGVINAVNMSDGHDGLAGSMVCVTLASIWVATLLVTLCAGAGEAVDQSFLAPVSMATVLGFLTLNARIVRPRAKVFMGDAGSTMLGLLLAYLLIHHTQVSQVIRPVTALWLLALPLIDAVAVLIVRPLRGQSPFAADRIHYHHQLIDRGVSVNKAVLVAVALQSGLAALGLAVMHIGVPEYWQLAAFLVVFLLYLLSLLRFTRARSECLESTKKGNGQ